MPDAPPHPERSPRTPAPAVLEDSARGSAPTRWPDAEGGVLGRTRLPARQLAPTGGRPTSSAQEARLAGYPAFSRPANESRAARAEVLEHRRGGVRGERLRWGGASGMGLTVQARAALPRERC